MFRHFVLCILIKDLLLTFNGCYSLPSHKKVRGDVEDDLLVTGGMIGIRLLSNIEVLNPTSGNIDCDPKNLPYKVTGHKSVYSKAINAVITCGGEDEDYEYLSKCILQRKGKNFPFPSMHSKRHRLTLHSISDTIFAIGGRPAWVFNGSPYKNTMEFINLNKSSEWTLQETPFSVYLHCSVTLSNHIIVTGGLDAKDNRVDTTWIYDVLSKTWSEGPKMNIKRRLHSCVVDEATSTVYVMGGWNERFERINSTEKWIFGTDSWQPSTNLPIDLSGSSAVSSTSNEYIGYMAGGYTSKGDNGKEGVTSKVWGLSREDKTWVEMNITMQMGRYEHTLLKIPVDKVLEC